MRIARSVLLVCLFVLVSRVSNARQASAPALRDTQTVSVLQRSLAALTGTNNLTDVTLNANANWTAGSDEETGSATLKATAMGQGRIDLSLSNGTRSEVIDASQAAPTGSWCGTDGTWHAMVGHNLITDPTWFFPAFLISRALSNTSYAVSPMDAETRNGVAVEHMVIYEPSGSAMQQATQIQGLGQIDLYLNSSSLLPASISFNTHPDNNALINISIQVQFSNFQVVQGISIPYHIQKYIQNSLSWDMNVTGVQINIGLPASDFQAQ